MFGGMGFLGRLMGHVGSAQSPLRQWFPGPDQGEGPQSAAPGSDLSSRLAMLGSATAAPMGFPSTLPVMPGPREVDYDAFTGALTDMESGGNYGATGPMVKGDRALGRYQIMGANVPSWSRAALGREVSQDEFLANPGIQDEIYRHRMSGYLEKYGTPEDALSMWHSGLPFDQAVARGRRDVNMSTEDYVSKIMARYRNMKGI